MVQKGDVALLWGKVKPVKSDFFFFFLIDSIGRLLWFLKDLLFYRNLWEISCWLPCPLTPVNAFLMLICLKYSSVGYMEKEKQANSLLGLQGQTNKQTPTHTYPLFLERNTELQVFKKNKNKAKL